MTVGVKIEGPKPRNAQNWKRPKGSSLEPWPGFVLGRPGLLASSTVNHIEAHCHIPHLSPASHSFTFHPCVSDLQALSYLGRNPLLPLTLWVSLSAFQFKEGNFIQGILQILKRKAQHPWGPAQCQHTVGASQVNR